MGVKIVKGIAGQYEALSSPSRQISRSSSSPSIATAVAQSAVAATHQDAAVSSVRGGGRPEKAERLTLEKAQKLAKEIHDEILQDEGTALQAVGREFSISGVRDAFGV